MSESPGGSYRASSPPESRSSSKPPQIILKLPPTQTSLKPSRNFFVAPPHLPSAQKRQYKHVNESTLNTDPKTRVNEVIGEYNQGNKRYYYGRYDGGIAYKFPSEFFEEEYPQLVASYQRKKSDGTLAPFDPSAQYVHPHSRPTPRIKLPLNANKISQGTPSVGREIDEVISDSEAEEASDESIGELDDEEYNGQSSRKQPTRNARSNGKKELPFSPRKSRSQRFLPVAESDSESVYQSGIEISRTVRRSTRARKATEINLESDEDEFLDDDYDEADAKKSKNKGKGKSKKGPKSAQPMYGHFRPIDTLDQDPFSDDEENEALRRHRGICEKCHLEPAHKLLAAFRKKSKGKGKKRRRNTDDEFEESENEQTFIDLGGWVQCLKCPVSAHWKCLAGTQRDEVLKAVRAKDREEWEASQSNEGSSAVLPRKRSQLEIDQTTEFICGACMRGGICMGCMDAALSPDPSRANEEDSNPTENNGIMDVIMQDGGSQNLEPPVVHSLARELLFRCFTCKRLAHYRHLPKPLVLGENPDIADVAENYQQSKSWLCADCSSYKYSLDKIIAWRPYPANAVEPSQHNQPVNYKATLPREYLVKWSGRSYRRLEWVPHMWLVSTNPSKLKNFISGGTKIELQKDPSDSGDDAMEIDAPNPSALFEVESQSRSSSSKPANKTIISPLSPLPDAEKRIPSNWKKVDRVLDVLLWRPDEKKAKKQVSRNSRKSKIITISSEDDESESDDEKGRISRLVFEKGEQPPSELTETFEEWEGHNTLEPSDIDKVAWAFIKWDDLGYDEATWDAPPTPGEKGYEAFKTAFKRFIDSQSVVVPKNNKKYWEAFDKRNKEDYRKYILNDASDLDLGQDPHLKLMPFQVDGFNWLGNNWWNHQHCILADEMGLGKTVQIVSFLGSIAKNWNAFPALVVVPNSTITNWVREFERWAPRLRVVPFYGEKVSRDVLKRYELFHKDPGSENTKTKFHVLVTTYEALINGKDFTPIFKNQPRWEVLVVDEGQRLKSDSSLLFKKLNELNSIHRIIMTGTPLNNNMRELFNLMNFLDPQEWKDLEGLEKQHETLNEDLVKQLHNRLRPYFLRRIKSEVLDLPPKNEVIVPVSMAPLQREVYRSILSHNLSILNGLTQPSVGQGAPQKGRINNVLMQLRKCLQHPYIYDEAIEPRNLSPQETHDKLIDGSGKLRFLKALLPKLKEHGHRVLLFSQFVIALNVVEDFLQGEGYKFLRLDGNTKGAVRQKAMDEFNKPNSEYFIFLLTTRAGGVGINLYTADTVIIFDPDFNPHQDLQAIARAYRFGQKKTCLVFKLMVKDSAEERIMQIGKKKLVLDHLIVQKMDDDEDNGGEDVQSILTYGAQALFESEESSRDITYTDNDIDKLLEKTEREAVKEAPKAAGGLTFSFAKIWAAEKDSLEDIVEEDQTDSWAQTLQKINAEREKEQAKEIAQSGRGARRKAADVAKTKIHTGAGGSQMFSDKAKETPGNSDGSAYFGSDKGSEIDSDGTDGTADKDFTMNLDTPRHKSKSKSGHQTDDDLSDCGLCGTRHGPHECRMMDSSENLAEYREMLILHNDDEPFEDRRAAIQAIDEILHSRGHLSLIAGQPLHPIQPRPASNAQSCPPLSNRKTQDIPPTSDTVKTKPRESNVAGSSKQEHTKKKTKNGSAPFCLLCGLSNHFIKDCSIVLAGSKSISTHIKQLEGKLATEPSLKNTLDILRNLLARAKAQEMTTM